VTNYTPKEKKEQTNEEETSQNKAFRREKIVYVQKVYVYTIRLQRYRDCVKDSISFWGECIQSSNSVLVINTEMMRRNYYKI